MTSQRYEHLSNVAMWTTFILGASSVAAAVAVEWRVFWVFYLLMIPSAAMSLVAAYRGLDDE